MTRRQITENITLIGSKSVSWWDRQVARERAAAERQAQRAELIAWLDDPANWDDELYSDIHKDVYGFRP